VHFGPAEDGGFISYNNCHKYNSSPGESGGSICPHSFHSSQAFDTVRITSNRARTTFDFCRR